MPDKNGRSFGVKMLDDMKGEQHYEKDVVPNLVVEELQWPCCSRFPVALMPAHEFACAEPTDQTAKPPMFASRHFRAQLQRSTEAEGNEHGTTTAKQATKPVGIIKSVYDTTVQTWKCTRRHHIERSKWSSSRDHQHILHPADTPVVSMMNLAAISPYFSPYVT